MVMRDANTGAPLFLTARLWQANLAQTWLGNHRRHLLRWEKHFSIYLSFSLLGCLMIALRQLPCR